MERSAMLAQNAPFITQEMMLHHCDGDIFYICTICNEFADRDIQ